MLKLRNLSKKKVNKITHISQNTKPNFAIFCLRYLKILLKLHLNSWMMMSSHTMIRWLIKLKRWNVPRQQVKVSSMPPINSTFRLLKPRKKTKRSIIFHESIRIPTKSLQMSYSHLEMMVRCQKYPMNFTLHHQILLA